MTNPGTITETDLPTEGLYLTDDELEVMEQERVYAAEVTACCGGRAPWCGHWTGTSTGYGVTHA